MAFEFTTTSSNPVTIRLNGRMTLGPRLLEFGRHVTGLLGSRKPAGVILDLSAVTDIDSAGLGELVILFTTAGQQNCRLCLLSPTARTARLLETTRLSGILTHFDSELDAHEWIQS